MSVLYMPVRKYCGRREGKEGRKDGCREGHKEERREGGIGGGERKKFGFISATTMVLNSGQP